MTPLTDFDGQLVRDVLTKGQIHWIKEERTKGRMILICLESSEGSFAGYFPMNSTLREGLQVRFLQNGNMDTCPIIIGG